MRCSQGYGVNKVMIPSLTEYQPSLGSASTNEECCPYDRIWTLPNQVWKIWEQMHAFTFKKRIINTQIALSSKPKWHKPPRCSDRVRKERGKNLSGRQDFTWVVASHINRLLQHSRFPIWIGRSTFPDFLQHEQTYRSWRDLASLHKWPPLCRNLFTAITPFIFRSSILALVSSRSLDFYTTLVIPPVNTSLEAHQKHCVMAQMTINGFMKHVLFFLMIALASAQSPQCPNNLAVYNPNLRTACVNGSILGPTLLVPFCAPQPILSLYSLLHYTRRDRRSPESRRALQTRTPSNVRQNPVSERISSREPSRPCPNWHSE